jgi:ligand-binding SRPBCC domain-containing protein
VQPGGRERALIRPVRGGFELTSEVWLPRTPAEVFPFFADAHNLDRITPPWLHFRVVTPPPIEMRRGARIEYRLRLHGVPIRWHTVITVWDQPRRFVDEQLGGPYRRWRHEHTFEPAGGGTLARDRVAYAMAGGRLAQRLLVGRDLDRIFAYRRAALVALFPAARRQDG